MTLIVEYYQNRTKKKIKIDSSNYGNDPTLDYITLTIPINDHEADRMTIPKYQVGNVYPLRDNQRFGKRDINPVLNNITNY